MKLDDMINLSLARVDEDEDDANIDPNALTVVKNAINQAYMMIRTTIDRRLKTAAPITATNPIAIPVDCVEVTKAVHSVDGEYSKKEYYPEGDKLYFYPNVPEGTIILTYVEFPAVPTLTTEEIAVKEGYIYGMVTYGAYAYQLFRRKYSAAQLLFKEYESLLMPEKQKPKN